MQFTTKVTKNIEDIPRDLWDRIYKNDLEGYQFYKTMDESNFSQFSFYYISVYNGGEMVGAAPCFSLKYSLDTSVNGPLRKVFNNVKRVFPDILSVKAVVCGVPMGQGRIGMMRRDAGIVEAILDKLEDIACHEDANIIAFKDFPLEYADLFRSLTDKKFFKVNGLPYAEKDINFKNFDEYLMSLSGATRYDLRRKFRKVDGNVNITMDIVDDLDDDELEEVYDLYMQMIDKHEMGFEVVPVEFFRNILKNMNGNVKFFLWRIEGKIAAFLFCMLSGSLMIDYYMGLDYELAYKYHLYFVKHRDVMKWCAENGIKKYEMGFSGYEAKKRLGLDFVPLDIYVRHNNRIVNPVFRLLSKFLEFENFDPDIKAIKEILIEKRKSYIKNIHTDILK